MAGPGVEKRAPGAARSAERDVERLIFICFAVFRAGVVVQMVGSTVWLAFESDLPAGSAAMCFAAAAWSACLFVHVGRLGSFAACSAWWCMADVGVGLAALVSAALTLPAPLLVGTWHVWAYAYIAVVAPSVAAWAQPAARSVGLAGGLATAYVITVLPGNADLLVTVLVNALSCVIFAAAAAVGAINVRRLGRTADANAARAAKLAARLEREKYRFYVHNATGLLAHFGLNDIPPEILPALRHQALQESNRLRADFLADLADGPAAPDADPTLDEAVRASVAGFEHLPLAVRTALARGVRLPRDEALALQTAVVSLLYNVQFHAGPDVTEVVVHAGAHGDAWEVSVCDDGRGFDPEATSLGFGLAKQVVESARSKGMSVEVKSTPGEGTCVFIRGARRDSPSPTNA